MHAPKIARPSSTVFTPLIPKTAKTPTSSLQGREKPQNLGSFSSIMMSSFGEASARVLQTRKAKLAAEQQGKGADNIQAASQPADALKGSGQPLAPAWMTKYEGLLGENVNSMDD